jgi:biopolymer transport protein ExbD
MRFKQQRQGSQIPDINLVPMLDVLMVVLTFFIIVSMTLTTQQGVEVQLPSKDDTTVPEETEPKVAIVELGAEGELLFDDQPTAATAVSTQVKTFLQENPKGFVVLKAAEAMPYEEVVALLGTLKAAGGERVSLAIE